MSWISTVTSCVVCLCLSINWGSWKFQWAKLRVVRTQIKQDGICWHVRWKVTKLRLTLFFLIWIQENGTLTVGKTMNLKRWPVEVPLSRNYWKQNAAIPTNDNCNSKLSTNVLEVKRILILVVHRRYHFMIKLSVHAHVHGQYWFNFAPRLLI